MPLFFCVLLTLLAVGCARASRQEPTDNNVRIELEVDPNPPEVGEATLIVRLTDAAGAPIEDATLAVKGDMSHAGMEPVIREASGGPAGVYEIPFEWTMGGVWIVTVDATLPDGETVSRRFDLGVAGGM